MSEPKKSKQLSEMYGGKWRYDGYTAWICDDGKRVVHRQASCLCDDVCNHRPHYLLTGNGTPENVSFLGEFFKIDRRRKYARNKQ